MKYAFFAISFTVLASSFGLTAVAADAKDAKGSSDHPLISRFPDTFIQSYVHSDYDAFSIATGPITPDMHKSQGKTALPPIETFEGEKTVITYETNGTSASALGVYRNFEKAFKANGLETVFSCNGEDECGKDFVRQLYHYGDPSRRGQNKLFGAANIRSPRHNYYYWSGKAMIDSSQYVIALAVAQRNGAASPVKMVLDVNKVDTLNEDQITINVKGMSDDIARKGRVVLDGIYFDTDKATLTQNSLAAIAVIADYLKTNTNQRFFVVGHTDTQGSLEHNNQLSEARARAVIKALATEHGIQTGRLLGVGVGPVSPATSNANEGGRAQNRRVELVLR